MTPDDAPPPAPLVRTPIFDELVAAAGIDWPDDGFAVPAQEQQRAC